MALTGIPTLVQRSAGGVVFRRLGEDVQIALICVGEKRRWQLPKGLIENGEAPEVAALREVREEAGVESELIAPLDVVEYWYFGTEGRGAKASRVRYHKFVHFFLLEYRAGDVRDHDNEVEEARWVALEEASGMIAFANERRVVEEAIELLVA
jgi:8-oxo-dGTP pyrophosphatase MutT (NUDIX family)